MDITIRIWLYRNGLKEKTILVKENNIHMIKFLLDKELKKLRSRLKFYKNKGVIDSIARNPKVKYKKYRIKVKEIVYSRRSILQMFKVLRTRWIM